MNRDGYEPDEIEVTPEMLSAGLFAFERLSGAADEFEVVQGVYIAMARERSAQTAPKTLEAAP
jgi:hypothetical protein